MKGYMKVGRVMDTVRMLEAMRHQEDTASHPDHVTYTTVVSAFVNSGSMDRARQVLAEMVRISVPANRITYNILLKGLNIEALVVSVCIEEFLKILLKLVPVIFIV